MVRNVRFQSLSFPKRITMPLSPERRAAGIVYYYRSFVFLEVDVRLDSPVVQICQVTLSCHQNL